MEILQTPAAVYISKQSKTLTQFYSKRNLPVLAGFLRCRKAGV